MTQDQNEIQPRYEFRLFGQNLGRETDAIRGRSACREIGEVEDIYLVTRPSREHNVKIRANCLDVKKLLRVEQGLELWLPLAKRDFPVPPAMMEDVVFEALSVKLKPLPRGDFSGERFLAEIVLSHPEILVARVFKRRFRFSLDHIMVEIDELLVNGAAIQSIAIEDEDAVKVLQVRQALGLQSRENTSYVAALKRIMGIDPPQQKWRMQ